MNLRLLDAKDFMDVLDNFYVEDAMKYAEHDELVKHREKLRIDMIRYNERDSSGDGNDNPTPTAYLEPDVNGIFPGLEDGFMG